MTLAQTVTDRAGTLPAGPLHHLQDLAVPLGDRPRGLYLRAAPDLAHWPTAEGAPLHLAPGQVLSTDTFFGSFYRAYWHSVGMTGALLLDLGMTGRARLRVIEDTGRGIVTVLTRDVTGDAVLALDLADLAADGSSRLYVELEASAPVVLTRLAFCTDRAPLRQARLSIGLCTFNQEAYFARTLARLTALAEAEPRIGPIIVVNQGAAFADPALQALCRHPAVRLIQQRNLGGCGGFTRGLAEVLALGDAPSHHLLMDDDIVLDERMILRALRFLDHASGDLALGAGMFDALRPEIMYEAGAFLRKSNRIEPYAHNVNLADSAQLWRFNARVPTDYNAWWFCILPVAAVRRLLLPAPVFIRGDDFEYGLRLLRAGIPTVTLPGIGVWHEPFYAKPPAWQDYYDLRNRLILAATYPDRVDQLSLAHVAGLVTTAILTHNYAAARLRLMAIGDFLSGPTLLDTDAEVIHGRVMALARTTRAERLDATWAARPVAPPSRPRPLRMLPLMLHQALSLLRTGLGPLRRGSDLVLMDVDAHPGRVAGTAYVVTNGPRSFHLRFTPDRAEMWRLTWATLAMIRRYRAGVARQTAAWGQAIPGFRQPGWWETLFSAPPKD